MPVQTIRVYLPPSNDCQEMRPNQNTRYLHTNRLLGQVSGFQIQPAYSMLITIFTSLEVNISIIAACIPPIRPLFRFFDRTHYRSPRHGSRQGYSEQKRPKRRTSLFATHMGTTDEEFGLSVFVSAGLDRDPVDDTSSQKSMLPSQVPPAITKTTQIDISN